MRVVNSPLYSSVQKAVRGRCQQWRRPMHDTVCTCTVPPRLHAEGGGHVALGQLTIGASSVLGWCHAAVHIYRAHSICRTWRSSGHTGYDATREARGGPQETGCPYVLLQWSEVRATCRRWNVTEQNLAPMCAVLQVGSTTFYTGTTTFYIAHTSCVCHIYLPTHFDD